MMKAVKLTILGAFLIVQFTLSAIAKIAPIQISDKCPKEIAEIVCLVDPIRNLLGRQYLLDRTCLPESKNYIEEIIRIYEAYDTTLKEKMCGLNRIFIEKSFWASGYAHRRSNAIGIRQEIFDKHMSLSEWATWKEQLTFGRNGEDKTTDSRLPVVTARISLPVNGAAFYIVTHEIAHLIDMSLGASYRTFGFLSWKQGEGRVQPIGLGQDWTSPCFYFCKDSFYSAAKAEQVYEAVVKSPFVSLYATRNPAEDFAETLTYVVMARLPDFEYVIQAGDGAVVNIRAKLASDAMQSKRAYINKLLGKDENSERHETEEETNTVVGPFLQ